MLEQDCDSVNLAILAGQEYWSEVAECLELFYKFKSEEAERQIREVRKRLADAGQREFDRELGSFNPLMQYHVDPFDVAANIANVRLDAPDYQKNLEAYRQLVLRKLYGPE
jgi:hypothetical protein